MKTLSVIFFLILVFTCSCKKEDESNPPIIKPLAYFPVYPGSWWKYLVNDTIFVIDTTSSTYILNCYRDSPYLYGTTTFSDPAFVPYLNGKPIYEYYSIVLSGFTSSQHYSKWGILSEEIGFKFTRGWTDPRLGIPEENFVVKKKYFNGMDSILVIEGHWTDPTWGNSGNNISLEEYAKGIGLLKRIVADTVTHDTSYSRILTDYYISYDSTSLDHALHKMD